MALEAVLHVSRNMAGRDTCFVVTFTRVPTTCHGTWQGEGGKRPKHAASMLRKETTKYNFIVDIFGVNKSADCYQVPCYFLFAFYMLMLSYNLK